MLIGDDIYLYHCAIHLRYLMNVKQLQAVADLHANHTHLAYRLLSSTPTIPVNYYYSNQKLMPILPFHGGYKADWCFTDCWRQLIYGAFPLIRYFVVIGVCSLTCQLREFSPCCISQQNISTNFVTS